MKYINHLGLSLTLIILCLFSSCSDRRSRQEEFKAWMEDNGKIKVLSMTGMINDIVKRVGGEDIDSIMLIQGELDPHSYQLVKGDDEKLIHADVIFSNGLGLEHGPSLHQYLSNESKNVSFGEFIEQQDPEAIIYVNGQKDPHIWMDISLWAKAIPIIVKTLSERRPDRSAVFEERGQELKHEMLQIHAKIKRKLHQIPEEKRYLVTSHDAFNYFARAYLAEEAEIAQKTWGKRFAAPEGLAPESQLSTHHIKEVIDHLKLYQIHLLFPESNVSRDSIKKILQSGREQGLDIRIACCPLYGDAMGPPGSTGESYLKMIGHNADMLFIHMSGKGDQH